MIIISGSVDLRPESRDEAFDLGKEHSARSRSEPGCIAHNCYADAEDPNRMHFFEKWKDVDAVRVHFRVPESSEFVRDVTALAVGQPEIEIYSAEQLNLAAS